MTPERHTDGDAGPSAAGARPGLSGREWITRFAEELGLDPPDDSAFTELLAIAGIAAHASERIAAPIACYLIGRAGVDPAAARALAERVDPERRVV